MCEFIRRSWRWVMFLMEPWLYLNDKIFFWFGSKCPNTCNTVTQDLSCWYLFWGSKKKCECSEESCIDLGQVFVGVDGHWYHSSFWNSKIRWIFWKLMHTLGGIFRFTFVKMSQWGYMLGNRQGPKILRRRERVSLRHLGGINYSGKEIQAALSLRLSVFSEHSN